MKQDRQMEGEELAFAQASGRLLVKSLEPKRTFAEGVEDFRKLEAEFLARVDNDQVSLREIPRRIAETILSLAREKHPPFEVCREAWNDLVRLGFSSIERQC